MVGQLKRRVVVIFNAGFFAFPLCKEKLAMLSSPVRAVGQSPARTLDIILRSTLSLVECYGPRILESTTLNDLKFAFRSTIAELQMIEAIEQERALHETERSLDPTDYRPAASH
jgi:hypothetical protein